MRETRLSGSEGGAGSIFVPAPIHRSGARRSARPTSNRGGVEVPARQRGGENGPPRCGVDDKTAGFGAAGG